VAPGAVVVGDVSVGNASSIWFNAIVRGDVNSISIGARTNIQDGSVVHVTSGEHPATIGDDVTVGHLAILHGCTVEDGCLIGMRATVLDGAVVGAGSLVAAGSLLVPGTRIPPGSLVVGAPARVKRPLTPEERAGLFDSAARYVEYSQDYLRSMTKSANMPE